MALPSLIALIVIQGPSTIVPFILMVLLATMLSIFLVNAVYILILKITKPSNFQSVISYFQIAFAVFIYGGYQLLPRMMAKMGVDTMKVSEMHNILYYPPFWFADVCNSLATFTFKPQSIYSLMLAFGIPLLSIYMVVKYFAPAFNRNLSMISSTSEETVKKPLLKNSTYSPRLSWLEKLAQKITSSSTEYMGFLFAWKMMGRSREFKMKVYPGFGYMIVFIAMMILQSKAPSLSDFSDLSERGKGFFIVILYFSSFILISAIGQLRYSEKYKAAWLFAIAPIDKPGKLIIGALKSVIVSFYIPVILIVSILGIAIIGPVIIPNLILGCFNVLAVNLFMAYINLRELPFSVSAQNQAKGRTTTRNFIATLFPVLVGVFHWLIFNFIWAVVILAILAVIATWMMMDSIKNLTWAKIENFDVNR